MQFAFFRASHIFQPVFEHYIFGIHKEQQLVKIGYLSHMEAANAYASMYKRAVSPEFSLLSNTNQIGRRYM